MSILQRIQMATNQLAESEAKVAHAILQDPHVLEHYTITTLAQNSGTSTSAVLRFCHTLGFGGYKDFRYALTAELREGGGETGAVGDPMREVVRGMAEAVAALADLEADTLRELADAIVRARLVVCAGIHRSFLPADKLRMDLEDLGILALSGRDGVQLTHFANLVGDDTCTLIFSASGQASNYRAALDAGLAPRGSSWLITSNLHAQLASQVGHVIVLPSARRVGAAVVDEHPIAMAFVELLVQYVRTCQS